MRNLLLSNGILILTLAVPTLRAQTCFELDVKVSVDGTSTVQRSKLASYLAKSLGRSVLMEYMLQANDRDDDAITLPQAPLNVMEFAQVTLGKGITKCEVDNGVVHLYTQQTIRAPQNGLGHIFRWFDVPNNAGLFILAFRNRLYSEAFDPTRARQSTGPAGGGMRPEDAKVLLRPEVIRNVSARELFLREATQEILSLSIGVPVQADQGLKKTWNVSRETMHLEAISNTPLYRPGYSKPIR